MAYKGGELALALQRERAGAVVNDPARYLGGDRFRLLATCPPAEEELRWEVVVFQGGEAFFPLSGGQRLRCGNAVPLPGAFRLTGSGTATICLIAGADLPSRGSLARQGQTALPADATVCVALEGGVGE
ncbi:MAG: hypothetical protein FJ125_06975 [Deltaproteobacteria bacterium]|nr:hypothetical protein [Deltaproteobacteria bacterium]